MSSAVAKHYAGALFEVASKLNQVQEVEGNLTDLSAVLTAEPEYAQFLAHPLIAPENKKQTLETIFGPRVSTITLNMLQVLIDNGRIKELHSLTKEFTRIANEARGIAEAEVKSAVTLSEAQLNDIAAQFGKITGKTIRVNPVVDPTVLGGIVVRIGDRVYDGSIKSKLNRIGRSFNVS